MTGLSALWLPLLLSAVMVFVASSVIHMASPWHKSDYPKMPNEDQVMDALRPLAIPPGDYFFPRPSSRDEMRSPAFAENIAGRALPPGTAYPQVFRFVGATAFIGYALALWQMSIWYRRAWTTTIKATVDGLIYALLTAGTFGWLWPR